MFMVKDSQIATRTVGMQRIIPKEEELLKSGSGNSWTSEVCPVVWEDETLTTGDASVVFGQ